MAAVGYNTKARRLRMHRGSRFRSLLRFALRQSLVTPVLIAVPLFIVVCRASAADLSIESEDSPGAVRLVLGNTTADIYVDARDARVSNIAAGLLSDDIERVTGRKPRVVSDPAQLGASAVIVGTIGQSSLVDQLISSGK